MTTNNYTAEIKQEVRDDQIEMSNLLVLKSVGLTRYNINIIIYN